MLIHRVIAAVVLVCTTLDRAQAQFQPGEFVTHSQDAWGGDPAVPGSGAALVAERFFFVYPNGVSIGTAGASVFFTSGQAVVSYLPTSGGSAPLFGVLVDPTSTASGAFGGHLLALQLNVDFADAGYLPGSAGVPLGDLKLVGMSSVQIFSSPLNYSAYEGLTVRQLLAEMNVAIGTAVTPYNFDRLYDLTEAVTRAFEGGQPSQFAQNHLRIVPEPAAVALAWMSFVAVLIGRRVVPRHRSARAARAACLVPSQCRI